MLDAAIANSNATETSPLFKIKPADDTDTIAMCHEAIALLARVRGWNDGTIPYPGDDEANLETHQPARALTRKAMASEVSTLNGVRAQAALLLWHHEQQGSGPEHPEIELPVLRNLLRIVRSLA
jgi:hypothetical protein